MGPNPNLDDPTRGPREAPPASRREQILALLTAGDPDTPLVQRVCEVSAAVLGVSGAGMCLIGGRSQQIVVHGTTALAEQLEDLQLTLGQGPCMQAVRTGSPILVPDLATHQTVSWPVFADHARDRGVRALFAIPLETGITTLGALDLYRDTPGPLSGAELMDALLLTAIAAQAMAAQRDRVYLDGSVSALHWVATGHPLHAASTHPAEPTDPAGPAPLAEPAGTPRPGGEVVTRGRAVDLGITVAQARQPLWPDRGNDPIGDRPGPDPLPDLTTDQTTAHTTALRVPDTEQDRPGRGPGPEGRPVLVVADEPGMRLVLGRALRRLGYRVLLADTVAAGIGQLPAHPELAAVIADVTMPTPPGPDFGAAVIEHHPGVPILFLTGGPTASGVLDDPLIGLVSKPVAIGDLHTQLARLIDRAAETAAAPPGTPGERTAAGRGPLIGAPGRRVEPGGRLAVLPELDADTVTWAAVAGLAGLTTAPPDAGPAGLSAAPGAGESARIANLGLFAAGVANEVNNMLAVVAMRADLLADGDDGHPPTPAAVEDITAITAAATRASGLVTQLMLFAGQRTLDRGPVDLAELVTDLRPRLDDIAGGPGIVACTVEPVPPITADHEHLERVLLNLIRNALDATTPPTPANPTTAAPDGATTGAATTSAATTGAATTSAAMTGGDGAPPRVRVRVTPTPAGALTPAVVLEVADSGPGMTPDVLARATEPFFRTATTPGGSGLGLAIVAGIITQHGGTLDLDSLPGRGTTVRVTLPTDPTAMAG